MIGDIEADVLAARAAGAIGVLVPTPVTRADEIERADLVAVDLRAAVAAALAVRRPSAQDAAAADGRHRAPVIASAAGEAA